ncbi:MAG: CDP-diacylglycerol--glycerol-3-phosphate 3-phosphatidyltransferase [Treponema sp.]|jgi:CDP-diacylglycerol--glycerol-3-phosphate 3-phosphatidyltransferase|nr:CDP-diacylglycerol--glycerol-3-phosphate 3-phosphatidyltransferase [Treponema sp.]
MTLADKLTFSRIFMAPLFFIVYLLPHFFPAWPYSAGVWTLPVLWVLFIVSEISDLLDGKVARARNEVSDFGKLFDPFSDVLVRITYFLCFVIDGIFPIYVLPLFLIVLYREFSIQFVRTLMMKKGIAMGAKMSGKIKAVTYMASGAVALLAVTLFRLGITGNLFTILKYISIIIFTVGAVMAVTSFLEYLNFYRKTPKAD